MIGREMHIEELDANERLVSVHKCGLYLCRRGSARVLLGSNIYEIGQNSLCVYTPNSFLQILERSNDLEGILEEDNVDEYYPMFSTISIRSRLLIRDKPCVVISDEQTQSIARLVDIIREEQEGFKGQYAEQPIQDIHVGYLRQLRYAVCLRVLEAYFSNTPVEAEPRSREAEVLHRFLLSVYEHCHRERMVQFYADEQHLSPYYFSCVIKSRSGRSALQWIEEITMTRIRQQLLTTEQSVKQLAARMNFPDQSTFCRYFKRLEGCTPLEYRDRVRQI